MWRWARGLASGLTRCATRGGPHIFSGPRLMRHAPAPAAAGLLTLGLGGRRSVSLPSPSPEQSLLAGL